MPEVHEFTLMIPQSQFGSSLPELSFFVHFDHMLAAISDSVYRVLDILKTFE
jgi:hypothetical protein